MSISSFHNSGLIGNAASCSIITDSVAHAAAANPCTAIGSVGPDASCFQISGQPPYAGLNVHVFNGPTFITAFPAGQRMYASDPALSESGPISTSSDLIHLLLTGAVSMVSKRTSGMGSKVKPGLFRRLASAFGISRAKPAPRKKTPCRKGQRKAKSKNPSVHSRAAKKKKKARTLKPRDAMTITDRPSAAPLSVEQCSRTQTGLDTERLGAILGMAPIIRLAMTEQHLLDNVLSHRKTAIAFSVAERVADDPESLQKKCVRRTLMWQALVEHDAFTPPTERLALPVVTPEQADVFRKAYDKLLNSLFEVDGLGSEEGEDPLLRTSRIVHIAEYYLFRSIHAALTLGRTELAAMTLDDFSPRLEDLEVNVKDVLDDLERLSENTKKYYGIDKECPPEASASKIVVNGMMINSWKIAQLVNTLPRMIEGYIRSFPDVVAEYIAKWQEFSFASQLCYPGGFEEFMAQDFIKDKMSQSFLYPAKNLKEEDRDFLAAYARNIAPIVGADKCTPIMRITRIGDHLVRIRKLSEYLGVAPAKASRTLQEHRKNIECAGPEIWEEVIARYDGDYHHAVARLLAESAKNLNMNIRGHFVRIRKLSAHLDTPQSRTSMLLKKYREALKNTDDATWTRLLQKYQGDYHHAIAELITGFLNPDREESVTAESENASMSTIPPPAERDEDSLPIEDASASAGNDAAPDDTSEQAIVPGELSEEPPAEVENMPALTGDSAEPEERSVSPAPKEVDERPAPIESIVVPKSDSADEDDTSVSPPPPVEPPNDTPPLKSMVVPKNVRIVEVGIESIVVPKKDRADEDDEESTEVTDPPAMMGEGSK